jgi:myo-inositol-1(or 4)-monophosphatase
MDSLLGETELEARWGAAVEAVREAGALALRMQAAPEAELGLAWKGERDFVTAADHAVEAMLAERLAARFGDGLVGEERGGAMAERLWVVDPIDGTYNYAHGLPQWCVSLGFLVRGELELGLIYNPARDELFAARRGQGATLNDRSIQVSGARNLAHPLVEAGVSNRIPFADYLALIGRIVAGGCEFRRLGSGALGLASVAAGRTDAYCELHINAWDVAAGILIVREAGGWTNNFLSGDWLTGGNPILAATPELRERLVSLTGIG